MIDHKTIRLGNIYFCPREESNIITSNILINEFTGNYNVNGYDVSELEEAEITEEILEYCTTFKLVDKNTSTYYSDGNIRLTPVWYNSIRVDVGKKYITNIYGIHELQNIYYSIYNQEMIENYLPQ